MPIAEPRRLRAAVVFASVTTSTALLPSCGRMPGAGAPASTASCPGSLEEVAKASWGLEPALEAKIKASLGATLTLQQLAGRLEGDLVTACSNLAKDLGAKETELRPAEPGPGRRAEAACGGAMRTLRAAKGKAQGTLTVKVTPPRCTASVDAAGRCAAECEGNLDPGAAQARCEGGHLSGTCTAQCAGTCTVAAGAECSGTCKGDCSGACEFGFNGKCSGKCEGHCDGQDVSGKCEGVCEGSCDAGASGRCGGTCRGSCSAECDVLVEGECKGTCSGECSAQMEAPRCTGQVQPPAMSAECQADCDAKLSAEATCSDPSVIVTTSDEADAEAALRLRGALARNLPGLLRVTLGTRATVERASGSVQASLEGLSSVVEEGGAAALQVGPCVMAAIKAQADASVSINLSVKASASASAEAGVG